MILCFECHTSLHRFTCLHPSFFKIEFHGATCRFATRVDCRSSRLGIHTSASGNLSSQQPTFQNVTTTRQTQPTTERNAIPGHAQSNDRPNAMQVPRYNRQATQQPTSRCFHKPSHATYATGANGRASVNIHEAQCFFPDANRWEHGPPILSSCKLCREIRSVHVRLP